MLCQESPLDRKYLSGAWYSAALVGEEWAALYPGVHIDTHWGPISLPGEDVLFLRITRTPRFMIAGKGHDSGRAWLWNGRWEDKGDTYGNTPCCFDHAGHLLISRPVNPPGYTQIDLINGGAVFIERSIGAQGIWYADGTGVHTGDECSAALQPDGQLIHDFTVLGDVTIGQGHESGAHLTKGADRHLIEGGLCRFMHPDRVGNDFAIPIWKEADGSAVIIRATLAELLDKPAPPTPPVDVPVLGRACWLGCFAGTATADGTWHTDTPPWTLPGNSYLSVPDDTKIFTTTGAFAAVFVAAEGEGTVEALEAAVQAAKHWGRPVLAYWPRGLQSGRTPACDWLGVECYLQPGETPAAAELRWRQLLGHVPATQSIGIIAQAYNAPDDVLSQLVPVYLRLARDTRVVGIFPFNGSGRPGGIQNRPTVRSTWLKAAEGIPAHPPIQEMPVVAAPKFTIVSPTFPVTGQVPLDVRCVYQNEPGGGELDWIEWLVGMSASGPWSVNAHNFGDDPDHTYHFTSAGTFYIKARGGNATGTHETGSERKVTARPGVPPIDPPPIEPVPPSELHRYRTTHGGYLQVGPDQFLREGPAGDAFEVVKSGKKDYVGLKVKGAFVAAEPDGRLKADRSAIGDWEYFSQTAKDETLQFFSIARQKYISAHDDGTVKADHSPAGGWETFTQEAASQPDQGGPMSALHVDQHLFRDATNAAVRIKGFSAFPFPSLFAQGTDLMPIIAFFRSHGANAARVWPYVTWPGTGWESPDNETIINLVRFLRSNGLYTYLTLFTDSQPPEDSSQKNRIDWAKVLVQDCQSAGLDSIIFEIGNEPQINKKIDTHVLKSTLDASGFLYTSGEYDDSAKWFGRFGDAHLPRDIQWCRKGHDLHEYFVGGGPSYPAEPATKTAWFSGEPTKPTEAPNAPQTDPDTGVTIDKVQDYLADGACCSLLGAGGIFHYEGGKFGRLPQGEEIDCAAAYFQGLNAFPAEMLGPGSYERIDEHGETLRTYKKGPYTVRIRPKSGPILIGAVE